MRKQKKNQNSNKKTKREDKSFAWHKNFQNILFESEKFQKR